LTKKKPVAPKNKKGTHWLPVVRSAFFVFYKVL